MARYQPVPLYRQRCQTCGERPWSAVTILSSGQAVYRCIACWLTSYLERHQSWT